ncbi:IS3 family transposase [Streptomyces sp. NPDC088246]|uniref:IS3 family transposase n=1 Tax=Streptomyces sp. NPDC088246 TaxID=3365842 RepID=UPI0038155518
MSWQPTGRPAGQPTRSSPPGCAGFGRHYGVPRITAELRAYGERVNHKKTARAMRQVGLAGLRLRHRHRTTVADSATPALHGTVTVAAIRLWLRS